MAPKSVSLGNIIDAYDKAGGCGITDEFAFDDVEKARAGAHGSLAGKIHTAFHEVIGHASGQLEPGVEEPASTLKEYASTMEEGRADLVALYFHARREAHRVGIGQKLGDWPLRI